MNGDSSYDEDEQMMTFQKRDEVKMNLSKTAQKTAADFSQHAKLSCILNPHLDPYNKAQVQACPVNIKHEVQFSNYFMKQKNRDERMKVFDELRNLLIQRGYNQISRISDRQQQQIMVVRVVGKVQNALNTLFIEDEFTQDKLSVRQGIMWVGMICAIKARWAQGVYKLQKIIDLSAPKHQTKAHLAANSLVNRTMFVKGPFRPKFGIQDEGIRNIANELKKLKRQNITINTLIVMGPILAKNNKFVQTFTLQRTYEQQCEYILANLKVQLSKILPQVNIYVMPSLDDIISLHPIPQPAYDKFDKKIKIKYLSNPSSIQIEGIKSICKIDLINYDILKFIDTHKVGKAIKQLRQQNMQTYIKQPFYLTNTTTSTDPFDQINIGNLYNNGNFGDLVVFSSNTSPPFVNEVNGRILLNIGSLGIDYHYTGDNFMVYVSIYEGEGPVSQRIKVQVITHAV